MEQLLNAFGIDAKLIVVQILNFVVLAAALSYFLYKPLIKMLDEREAKIKQGVADAEAAEAARAAADADRKNVLEAAHKEAADVHARATSHAKEHAASIVSDAEVRASDIVASAHTQSEHIKSNARAESEAEVAQLAILAAERALRERA